MIQAARASEGIYSCQLDFTNYFRDFSPSSALPAGIILPWAGQSTINIPNGYLLCDGGTASKTLYPNLFAALGEQWGESTATHFRLPDLARQVIVGSGGEGTDVLGNAVGDTGGSDSVVVPVPAHSHGYARLEIYRPFAPSIPQTTTRDYFREGRDTTDTAGRFGASLNPTQPSTVMRYIIKY